MILSRNPIAPSPIGKMVRAVKGLVPGWTRGSGLDTTRHHRERSAVQHAATRGRESRLGTRVSQGRATSCVARRGSPLAGAGRRPESDRRLPNFLRSARNNPLSKSASAPTGGANLLQPTTQAHRERASARGRGALLRLGLRGVSVPHEAPGYACRPPRSPQPIARRCFYVGEGSSSFRAYSTACSKVISRPSPRASSKAASPSMARASAAARSWSEGSVL